MAWAERTLAMLVVLVVVLMLHCCRGCNQPDTGSTFNESVQNSSLRTKSDHNQNFILGSSFMISAVEDVVIVFIIYMTKNIDRNTSYFLIAQCILDFVMEIWAVLGFFQVICSFNRLSFCILTMLRSLSLHLLTLSIFNIYIAVCKPTLHLKSRPWTVKVAVGVLIVVAESALHVLYVYADTSFYLDEGSLAPTPTYSSRNWWIGTVVLFFTVLFPVTVTILCQYGIFQFAKGCSAGTRRHIRLSYLIASVTAITVVTFLVPHILRALRIYNVLLTASLLFHMLFNMLKMPYYILVYRPFRNTVKRYVLCGEGCRHRNAIIPTDRQP